MRVLLYNIRYATGRRERHAWMDVLRHTDGHIHEIADFINHEGPDVVGLVEVDTGSYRSRGCNQAERIAGELGAFYQCHATKYRKEGVLQGLPVLRRQGNALITREPHVVERFHYFERGVKRLVIEAETEEVRYFLVHLSLRSWVRHQQLAELHELIGESGKPCIVMGDFNALTGPREMALFLKATDLVSANSGHEGTYPSWQPRRELDFICYSRGLRLTECRVLPVVLSDHRPLVADFELA